MLFPRLLAVLCLLALSASAQGLEFIRSQYTKFEFRIPMRDGKRLFTSVYAPKDAGQKFPIMLTRTPYSVSPYGVENYKTALGPSEKFAREQFIFVYQDVRGRNLSRSSAIRGRNPRCRRRRPPLPSLSRMATASSSAWGHSPASTRSTSRTTSPSGPR